MGTKRSLRFFNTTGPCNPDMHYMLPPEDRLVGAQLHRRIIFFVYFMFVCSFTISAVEKERKPESITSIKIKKQDLKSALSQLKKQSGCWLSYYDSIDSQVTTKKIKCKDKTISQVLELLLANSGYNFIYTVINGYMIYKEFPDFSIDNLNQESLKTGTVIDEIGDRVPGATVIIKLKGQKDVKTSTDKNGNFNIPIVHKDVVIFVIFIGYFERIVPIYQANRIQLELCPPFQEEVLINGKLKYSPKFGH